MGKRSRIDLKVDGVVDNVAAHFPMVVSGRGDPRNILGVVVDLDEHEMYRIAAKSGILSTKYCRNQFHLLNDSDINT